MSKKLKSVSISTNEGKAKVRDALDSEEKKRKKSVLPVSCLAAKTSVPKVPLEKTSAKSKMPTQLSEPPVVQVVIDFLWYPYIETKICVNVLR